MARTHPYLTKLRRLVATYPETGEVEAWGHPTFRVRDKIFASFGSHEGRSRIGVKQTVADQAVLTEDPRFEVARYVGKHGWISIDIDRVDWSFIEELVETSYRLIALKRHVKALDASRE